MASLALALSLKCQFWLNSTLRSSTNWFTSSLVAGFRSGFSVWADWSWVIAWGFLSNMESSFLSESDCRVWSPCVFSTSWAGVATSLAADSVDAGCSGLLVSPSSSLWESSSTFSVATAIGVSSAETGFAPATLAPNKTEQVPMTTEQVPTVNFLILYTLFRFHWSFPIRSSLYS